MFLTMPLGADESVTLPAGGHVCESVCGQERFPHVPQPDPLFINCRDASSVKSAQYMPSGYHANLNVHVPPKSSW